MKYFLDDFVSRYLTLRREHGDWTNQMIADEMQMTRGALDKALERARGKGHDIPPIRGSLSSAREIPPLSPRVRIATELKDVRPAPDWNRRAVCRYAGMDDDRFIPDGRVRSSSRIVQAVKDEYCDAGCPVKAECLLVGLKDPTHIGIWGGLLLPHQLDEVNVDKLKAEINERR